MPKLNTDYDTIVIGGGQAGLVTGYYLQQQGRDFAILDAGERVGDCWRKRWDSLELFTAAKYNSLPGMSFPAPDTHCPSKDEMADYLEAYAQYFNLPVQCAVWVKSVYRDHETYIVETTEQRYTARNVVIATGGFGTPNIPAFAEDLAPSIQQIHSSKYRNLQQLQDGDVLVVGAGSSGVQIALDIVSERHVWLAGRYTGYVPRFILGIDVFGLLTRTVFNFSIDTKIGRKVIKKMKTQGIPVVDIRESEVIEAGVVRTPRVEGVRDGKPVLEDGRVIDANIIIWATGYHNDFSWIKLPVFDEHGEPRHYRGIVQDEPGLYFVGLKGLYRGKSPLLAGVSADAEYIVDKLIARSPAITTAKSRPLVASEPQGV